MLNSVMLRSDRHFKHSRDSHPFLSIEGILSFYGVKCKLKIKYKQKLRFDLDQFGFSPMSFLARFCGFQVDNMYLGTEEMFAQDPNTGSTVMLVLCLHLSMTRTPTTFHIPVSPACKNSSRFAQDLLSFIPECPTSQ